LLLFSHSYILRRMLLLRRCTYFRYFAFFFTVHHGRHEVGVHCFHAFQRRHRFIS
jgi:hypothetical protein